MVRFRFISLLFLVLTIVSIAGCETEIDILAPKRDITVVYGILEPNKTKHYFRINRSFRGEQAADSLAGEAGITEYSDEEMEAFIVEFNPAISDSSSAITRTWKLNSEYVKSKDAGIFFSDSNKVYFFEATLDVTKHYRLVCQFNLPDEESKKKVVAETSIIGNQATSGEGIEQVSLLSPRLVGSSTNEGDRAEVDFIANGDYRQSQIVRWSGVSGGVSYTSYYRFYYTEVDKNTDERTRDSILFTIGTKRFNPNYTGTVEYTINPSEFYTTIAQNTDDYDFDNADFDRIASDTLQYFLEIADNELATYIEVNQPATEILQEQPEYTNVTNGIGIFASRLVVSTRDKEAEYKSGRVFKSASLEELLYSNQVNLDKSLNTSTKGFTRPGRCNDDLKSCR